MYDITRYGARHAALSVAIACALAACGRGNDSAASSGSSASGSTMDSSGGQMASGAGTGTTSMDSAGGMSAGGAGASGGSGAAMSPANIASMISTTNGAEIAAARLAERRGSSSGVKSFARQMITDHTKMQKSLDSLAKAKNITPQAPAQAAQMNQQVKQTADSLQALKGSAFDQQYIASQVQMHQQALTDLQQFSSQSQDADLRALIDKSIPIVQQHLQKAQQLQSSTGSGASGSGGSGGTAGSDSTKQ